jgi:hypothetical protein
MVVTSTGIVSRKSRGEGRDGLVGSHTPCNLLVRFRDPKTWCQKTQQIKCSESQFNRFSVGDMIGIQRNTAWWALWTGWRIAG